MISFSRPLICCILATSFVACNEDPELLKKHGVQETEIAKLGAELALVQERLKRLPEDKSDELKEAIAESQKLERERKQLASEVEKLEAEQAELRSQFDDYKRKYSIP